MRDVVILIVSPLVIAIISSLGVGTIIVRVLERKYELADQARQQDDVVERMLKGLAHDRIMDLGVMYIERGWLTNDEYENLHDYLYDPYTELGGNGTAKKILNDVSKLEIRRGGYTSAEINV